MIQQPGRVMRVEQGRARVALGPQSGCSACDAGQGCGAGLFGRLLRRQTVELTLDAPGPLRVGQAVNVGIPERSYLSLVTRLYGLPLLGALLGGTLGHSLAAGASAPVQDAVTALLGLSVGWAALMKGKSRAVSQLNELPIELMDGPTEQLPCAQAMQRPEPGQ